MEGTLGQAASEEASDAEIVEMATYLRETISEMDEGIAEMRQRRMGLALRLAVIESSSDEATLAAAADYEARVSAGTPYEDALDAEEALTEAWKRYTE